MRLPGRLRPEAPPARKMHLLAASPQSRSSPLRLRRLLAGSSLTPEQQEEAEAELDLIAQQVADEEALSLPTARGIPQRPIACFVTIPTPLCSFSANGALATRGREASACSARAPHSN